MARVFSVVALLSVLLCLAVLSLAVDTDRRHRHHHNRPQARKPDREYIENDPLAKIAGTPDGDAQKVVLAKPQTTRSRSLADLKKDGVVVLVDGLYDQVLATKVGSDVPDEARKALGLEEAFANAFVETDSSTQPPRTPTRTTRKNRCVWVHSESPKNNEVTTSRTADTCWQAYGVGVGTNQQCSGLQGFYGPGPFQTQVAHRYGKSFTCYSDKRVLGPRKQVGTRTDKFFLLCMTPSGQRVAVPAKCKPKISLQAAFYGEVSSSTQSSGVCPLGYREMDAFAAIGTTWKVNGQIRFTKSATTQTGNELVSHSDILPSMNRLFPTGTAAAFNAARDIREDFGTTRVSCTEQAVVEVGDSVESTLQSFGAVYMSAGGKVWGNARVDTAGWGLWYHLLAEGSGSADDCFGVESVHNYYFAGTEKYDELRTLAKRFFAMNQVTDAAI